QAALTGQVAYFIGTNQITGSNDFFWNDSTKKLGIGTNNPGSTLDVKGALRLSGSTSGYVGLSPAAAAGSTTYTLPSADGTNGQFLSTNGVGVLSWAAVGGGNPPGSIMQYAGSSAPAGYLLANGAAVSRATYAILFGAIGTTYGAGDGSTTFNLPNLKGRVAVGLDAVQTEFDALGETGGEKTHTLTTNEMPAHTHELTNRGTNTPGGSKTYKTDTAQTATGNDITTSIGGGAAHNVLDPYITLNYIIKI
ncbi:MAG TPA: tail fiber protein, partial [Candidatus Paceibacterota bacterium]|nr:tail fiber protein [Candidatus Paceibacterota bacterium]